MIEGMEVREVRLGDPEVAPLLEGLTEEYQRRYGESGEMHSVDAREFEPPDGVFLVLVRAAPRWREGACGDSQMTAVR